MAASVSPKTTKANAIFSLDLFKKLSDKDKTANIFYSPFSISTALAMVMLGTRGNTATQMSEVLGFTQKEESMEMALEQMQMQLQSQFSGCLQHLKPQNSEDDVHTSFALLLSELNKANAPYALSIANRLYGDQSYQFVEQFLDETRKYYNAELESVNFKTSAEVARVNINTWVEDQTQGKIKDLLAQGVLDDMTKLVLVNAIYFKGKWDKQFKERDTVDAQFRVNKNDTKPVKMMHQTSDLRVISIPEVKCRILEMFYEGKELSMLIFLPDEIEDDTTGLEKLESELTYENFMEWTRPDMMGEMKVNVMLPRFKMEVTYTLKDVLISMGMVDAFDVTKSNFSGISPANDLVVTSVVHKAFVDVNEEGTEAAAATGIVFGTTSFEIPVTFNADHPFLFFIRHNSTKSILFAGRYSSPE